MLPAPLRVPKDLIRRLFATRSSQQSAGASIQQFLQRINMPVSG